MPEYSENSRRKLGQCDQRLRDVFDEVIKHFDCTIVTGHRGKADQQAAFDADKSKVRWPDSRHNSIPSQAVDAAPYPIGWKDRERATYLAGVVMGIAATKGIGLRWGGDWDRDTEVADNKFDDLWHFELVEP